MRTRKKVIVVHLDEREYQELNQVCAVAQMSREEYLRQLMETAVIHVRDPEAYRKLSRQLTGIERNINQIAHVANATGRVEADMILDVLEQMVEVRDMFQETM